jgi:hypothetical protein
MRTIGLIAYRSFCGCHSDLLNSLAIEYRIRRGAKCGTRKSTNEGYSGK